MKNDRELFSNLYIACQARESNLDDFLNHENQPFPPSLSYLGNLPPSTSKSDLIDCLEKIAPNAQSAPIVDVVILDGSAVVDFIPIKVANTFQGYSDSVILPYINRQLQLFSYAERGPAKGNENQLKINPTELQEHVRRLDFVWNAYQKSSLKASERVRRGRGSRRRAVPSTKVPFD